MANPTVFISYSWDSDQHRAWVKHFATRLRTDGVDVTLDRWAAIPGDQLPDFMERAIRENAFVLIICTPHYKRKSEARQGGVGYEGDIITGEVFVKRNHRKFIPVLRWGDWEHAAPNSLQGKYYIDLRGESYSEINYQDLLSTLHGNREGSPPLGPPPQNSLVLPPPGDYPIQTAAQPSASSLRVAVSLRQYVYISKRKVEAIFPQIPASFVRSFDDLRTGDDLVFKTSVVTAYIEEALGVGSIEHPTQYFKGTLRAGCVVTDSEVFFGGTHTPLTGEQRFYVGLSGSLRHMLGQPFKELAATSEYVPPSLREQLRGQKAVYTEINSGTWQFHSYLHSVAHEAAKGESPFHSTDKQPDRRRVAFEHLRYRAERVWKLGKLLLLWFGPFLISLVLFFFIETWAIIPTVLSILWLIGAAVIKIVATGIAASMGTWGTKPIEETVRQVIEGLWGPAEHYEFLALTITGAESSGDKVLLGSPVYIALAERTVPW